MDLPLLERDDFFSAGDIGGRPGWRKILPGETGRLVYLRLPCGHVATLGDTHQIDEDGEVTPKVVCASKRSGKKCEKFADTLTLKGWAP